MVVSVWSLILLAVALLFTINSFLVMIEGILERSKGVGWREALALLWHLFLHAVLFMGMMTTLFQVPGPFNG